MSKAKPRDAGALVLGGVPRAHLMPPEVAQGKREASRRRGLISIIVLVAILVGSGVAGSYWLSGQAEQRLADERLITEQLLAEQLSYSAVLEVRRGLTDILEQRRLVTEREVLWLEVVTPYLTLLSREGVVDQAVLTTAALADPDLTPSDPLRLDPVATIIVTVQTAELPRPYEWLRAMESIPSFADASLDAIVREDTGYATSISISLNEKALSQRLSSEGAGS